jgi:hypothetical protein
MKMNPNSTIRYRFQRRHILDRDVSYFVELFDIRKTPDVALRSYCGGLELQIEMGNDERRQPYLIPEVRSFYRQLDRVWPHAAYCCELRTSFLLVYTLCQLDYLAVLERENAPQVCAYYKNPELTCAFKRGRTQIRRLGRRAGMTKAQILVRETEYAEYLLRRLGHQLSK